MPKLIAGGRWWILVSLLFIAYTGVLLWNNYTAQTELRHSVLARVKLDAEKRAAAITYFFSERRKEVRNLAESRTVAGFFTNRALKMSMEYGLRANLLAIRDDFESVRHESMLGAHSIYRRIALVDAGGEVLVDTDDAPRPPTVVPTVDGAAETVSIARDPGTGSIVATAPVGGRGGNGARIVAWIDAQQLDQQFIARADARDVGVELLLEGRTPVAGPMPLLSREMRELVERTDPPAGQAGEALAHVGTDLAAVTVPIADTPFRLVAIVPTSALFRQITPTAFLVGSGAAPLVVLSGILLIVRMRRGHRALRAKVIESDRQRDALRDKNSELEQEMRRREAVERRLREQGEFLQRQTLELQQAMNEAHQLARYDALTGLSNRMLFREALGRAIEDSQRNATGLAVLFLDLDRFKRINDTLGHTVGDELLREAAQRIQDCIRECDVLGQGAAHGELGRVARQGGDEFTVLLQGLATPADAGLIARRIIASITQPMRLLDHEVVVTASVGISVYPGDGSDVDTLLKNADAAMYSAKEQGRHQCRFYEASMQEDVMRRLVLESDMRQGLESGQFLVFYQPIFEARSGALTGVEALLRWSHPARGMVSPAEFIPVAEESGLIVQLTRFVLDRACRQVALWQAANEMTLTVAVNLSGRAVELVNVQEMVQAALWQSGLPPTQLEVELTESVLMERSGKPNLLLIALKALGVRVSIDDFGTGYSSLAYIKTFAIDTVKIDRSFVHDLPADANGAAIVRAIVAMARSLNLRVIAEGVETLEERDFLVRAGCDALQGFLLGRPVPGEEITHLLASRTLRPASATVTPIGAKRRTALTVGS